MKTRCRLMGTCVWSCTGLCTAEAETVQNTLTPVLPGTGTSTNQTKASKNIRPTLRTFSNIIHRLPSAARAAFCWRYNCIESYTAF